MTDMRKMTVGRKAILAAVMLIAGLVAMACRETHDAGVIVTIAGFVGCALCLFD